MNSIRSLCIYCGASLGHDPIHAAAAAELGAALARAGVTLVYGGGRVGLMGLAADACLKAGGKVIGIIPDFLFQRELGHGGATELHVVASMHERKAVMAELSDAFCALPGGIGTLDETIEILSWKQLGLHNKPVVLLDLAGYWQPFIALMDHVVGQGFARPGDRHLFTTADSVAGVLAVAEAQVAATPLEPVKAERF